MLNAAQCMSRDAGGWLLLGLLTLAARPMNELTTSLAVLSLIHSFP
jgi:hypothetical protein